MFSIKDLLLLVNSFGGGGRAYVLLLKENLKLLNCWWLWKGFPQVTLHNKILKYLIGNLWL